MRKPISFIMPVVKPKSIERPPKVEFDSTKLEDKFLSFMGRKTEKPVIIQKSQQDLDRERQQMIVYFNTQNSS